MRVNYWWINMASWKWTSKLFMGNTTLSVCHWVWSIAETSHLMSCFKSHFKWYWWSSPSPAHGLFFSLLHFLFSCASSLSLSLLPFVCVCSVNLWLIQCLWVFVFDIWLTRCWHVADVVLSVFWRTSDQTWLVNSTAHTRAHTLPQLAFRDPRELSGNKATLRKHTHMIDISSAQLAVGVWFVGINLVGERTRFA